MRFHKPGEGHSVLSRIALVLFYLVIIGIMIAGGIAAWSLYMHPPSFPREF